MRAALQTFTNSSMSCTGGCALLHLTTVYTLNFTHRRSCWKSGNSGSLIYARTQIFLFLVFMCSACLLVSWLIAGGGFTGAYTFSKLHVLLLLCASHGYRCALAKSHRLLDLDWQKTIKNRRSVSYLSQQFLYCTHKLHLCTKWTKEEFLQLITCGIRLTLIVYSA